MRYPRTPGQRCAAILFAVALVSGYGFWYASSWPIALTNPAVEPSFQYPVDLSAQERLNPAVCMDGDWYPQWVDHATAVTPTPPPLETEQAPSHNRYAHAIALESAPVAISTLQEESRSFLNANSDESRCPYNAAILYLINRDRLGDLLLSISLLLRNVPLQCPYPILLFHESDFEPSIQNVLRDKLFRLLMGRIEADGREAVTSWLEALNRLEFIQITFSLPEGISSNVDEVEPLFPWAWPGYHYMCNFFFADLTEHPRIRNLDYYYRLDTDSFIQDKMSYDPIAAIHQQGKKYGYVFVGQDEEFVTRGLFPTIQAYAETRPEIQQQLVKNEYQFHSDGRPGSYFNNFEVMHVPSFRTPEVRGWVENVTGDPFHIFKGRWGDAPLRHATVYMFLDVETEVERLCDLTYYHQYPIQTCSSIQQADDGR